MPTYCDVGKKVGQMRLHGREVGQVERLGLRVALYRQILIFAVH